MSKEGLTVPRYDLYDVDNISVGEQVLPAPDEQPVVPTINPLESMKLEPHGM
jgi:hypothetical protein